MRGHVNPNHANKRFDLSAVSTFTLETIGRVDHLTIDGRCSLLEAWPEQPGGFSYYSLNGIRIFDQDAPVAIAGLVGGRDRRHVAETVQQLRAETRYLMPIPGKRTNRSQVVLGPANQKIIIRCDQGIGFEANLSPARCRRIENLIDRSHSCLLGNLPVDLTVRLIDYGREAGTYMVLGAGHKQFAHLAELRPHALLLNQSEARHATGLTDEAVCLQAVFDALSELSPADHVVVMTGQGLYETFVAERSTGQQWTLDPERLQGHNGYLYTLGAGDTMAGVIAFLLGQQPDSMRGDLIRNAVAFAQAVTGAHLTRSASLRAQVRDWYQRIWDQYLPEPAIPVLAS
jgi:fructose-1-phosphate kinase PfkB-like protein